MLPEVKKSSCIYGYTNENLIATLEEVRTIQTEGSQRRRDAETELARIEGELKAKLLDLRK